MSSPTGSGSKRCEMACCAAAIWEEIFVPSEPLRESTLSTSLKLRYESIRAEEGGIGTPARSNSGARAGTLGSQLLLLAAETRRLSVSVGVGRHEKNPNTCPCFVKSCTGVGPGVAELKAVLLCS